MASIGIVASETYPEIMDKMIESAKKKAEEVGAEIVKVVRVPGSYDTPLAVKKLLEMDSIEGVVVLGSVIKGETDHDQLVTFIPAGKISGLSLRYNKPVALGITGPRQTREQAIARIPRAARVLEACVKMIEEFESL